MKPKIKSDQTTAGTRRPQRWLIAALLLLLCPLLPPFDSLAANAPSVRKIKLKVGDVFNYQINETYFYINDTVKSSSWFTFKVIGEKDSLYSMIAIPRKKITSTKNSYSDSRFPEESNFMSYMRLERYPVLPFNLSASGIVQPFTFPDSIITRIIKEDFSHSLLNTSVALRNIKSLQETLTGDFQKFFVNWIPEEGEKKARVGNQITHAILRDVSPKKDLSEFISTFEISPSDTLKEPGVFFWNNGTSKYKMDLNSGLISQMESETVITKVKANRPDVNAGEKIFVKIQKDNYEKDSTVTITGTLDKSCNPQTFNCYIITNYIGRGEKFVVKKDLEPGKRFRLDIPLKYPIATNLSIGNFGTFSSFLLEPGDSIHVTITANGVEYSGPDALKSKLALAMRNNRLNIEGSWVEEQAWQETEKWISTEQKKIEPFRDQISGWAYNEIRCDIYYSAMDRLLSYYYDKNNRKVNEKSFNKLFSNVRWDDYQSFSSMDMMRFLQSYLFRKLLIMKGLKENSWGSQTEYYYLAKIIFDNKIRYHALSQCVYEALKGNDLEEGRTLFNDYEKEYKGTGFYPFLKSKLENRAELGNGASIPKFEATDMNGKKVSLEKMKGKYVQLLFVNLEYEGDTLELKAYQKLKENLPGDKFEMITVFLNKDESLTKAYINKHHPKGILVSNPDWQLEQLKKFDSEYTKSFYLVNPKGIIVFSGAGGPREEFVKMIIEMINNEQFNEAEASISKSTLYWVLSLSAGAIVLTLVVVWLVTRAIKRREAMRREQLELKLGAVRSQLNPHFLFNAMSSIQFLVNHDEKEKANLFLSKFAQLMRKVLLQSETERVPLNDELENIKTYLELEALRHRFQYYVAVDEKIDLFNTEIPVMLLQPFVENAVIHGIAGMDERGEIDIRVERKDGSHIQIRITDNGQGYSNAATADRDTNGKGMQITQKRADLMMEKYGHEIAFEVLNRMETDSQTTGTEVTITIETER